MVQICLMVPCIMVSSVFQWEWGFGEMGRESDKTMDEN